MLADWHSLRNKIYFFDEGILIFFCILQNSSFFEVNLQICKANQEKQNGWYLVGPFYPAYLRGIGLSALLLKTATRFSPPQRPPLGPVHKLHGQDCAQIWVRFGCGDQRKTAGVAALR
jgi:hypothetical protein